MLKVDNTMLSCFTSCPRKFYWRHVRNVVRNKGLIPALEFGKAIHKALEFYYKGDSQEEAIEAFKIELPAEATDDKRNHANGEKILKAYFKKWGVERWEVLEVEQNLKTQITPELMLCGYIDLVVKQQGFRYNVEHKTSGNFRWFIENPNHQISGYVYLSRENGFPVEGSIVNILGVFKTKTDYARIMTSRTDEEMEDYLKYVKETAKNINHCAKENFYPKHTNQCLSFGSPCTYKNLCTTSEDVAERIVQAEFVKEEWKPWEDR